MKVHLSPEEMEEHLQALQQLASTNIGKLPHYTWFSGQPAYPYNRFTSTQNIVQGDVKLQRAARRVQRLVDDNTNPPFFVTKK